MWLLRGALLFCAAALIASAPTVDPSAPQQDFLGGIMDMIKGLLSFGPNLFRDLFGGLFKDGRPESCANGQDAFSLLMSKALGWPTPTGASLDEGAEANGTEGAAEAQVTKCGEEVLQRIQADFVAKAHGEDAAKEGIEGDTTADLRAYLGRQLSSVAGEADGDGLAQQVSGLLGQGAGSFLRNLIGGGESDTEEETSGAREAKTGGLLGNLLGGLLASSKDGEAATEAQAEAVEETEAAKPKPKPKQPAKRVLNFLGGFLQGLAA